MTTLYYHHPCFLDHDTGYGHPESAQRLVVIHDRLSTPEFDDLAPKVATIPDAIEAMITLVHDREYYRKLMAAVPKQGFYALDADTQLSPGSGQAALTAVASVCAAVDQICGGLAKNAFCALRPPGHHALPARAMGFCLFNNIAIAAEYARSRYPVDKVAIVDFDVHHGNGSQTAFERQPQVLYASSHEMPNYPGTGYAEETGVGNIFNALLTPGSSGAEFRARYKTVILPAIKRFQPDLLLISAGFDAHKDDPLASINLVEDDYRWITEELKQLADNYCRGRIISCLEGGYNLTALADSVDAHVKVLMQ